jgi:protein-S-isoprenylcysteine O-methyltransferase Ste14
MSVVLDVFAIILLFLLFAVPHSILAAFDLKKRITEKVGAKIAFYRIFYNLSAFLVFVAIYYLAPKPQIIIYDLQFPYDIVIFSVQFLGIVGFFWAGSYIDLKEFIGIKQIFRYYKGNYRIADLDEYHRLQVRGPFKISRHPIYFFSIVILGFRPAMDLFYLIFFVCMALYFYIGSFYEEKSLVKRYGEEYVEYQKKVPRLIPNPVLLFKNEKIR